MEIQQLRYYTEIIRQRGFTRAAQILSVSQPMLTRVIKQLEEELGVTLIERTSKHFRPTDAGELLYSHATELLQQYRDLYRVVDDLKTFGSGEVRLSTPGVLLDLYFSPLLKRFHRNHPDIDISITEEGSKLTAQSVLAGGADLGLVMLPVDNSAEFEIQTVTHSDCRLVVSERHRFAGREFVRIAELESERLLTFGDTATLHDALIRLCDREGFTPHIAYKSLMPRFALEMVSLDLCIAVLPEPVVRRDMISGLCLVPLEPQIPWDIAVIHKRNRYQSFAAQQLCAFILDYFQESLSVV